MPVLTAIDVLGVQRFVFSSNRLRDIVAGSYLVHWSTSKNGALKDYIPDEQILLAGGGNVIVDFNSIDEARRFTACYTRRLYDEAPGLEVVVAHKPFECGELARALQEIQIELARRKIERGPGVPLVGISVNASCRETGLPAVGFDRSDPTVPLSRGVLKRRKKKDAANAHWDDYLKDKRGCAFPMELDDLGRSLGDNSLIGVVHVDGNGVGERIKRWLAQKYENGTKDDVLRREYWKWSQAIDELAENAFQTVVSRVWQAIEDDTENGKKISGKPSRLEFDLRRTGAKWMLPLRPILLGGDDLTFVCDGRIALDLAETTLGVFENSEIPHLGKITACAGVALGVVHAPFSRAYELAYKLCGSAKRMLKEKNLPGCAMDWHIGIGRPGDTVTNIREKQYRANTYHLTCRPYRLGSKKDEPETWRWLSETLLDDPEAGLRGREWSGRRNKAKAFVELAREGPNGVKAAMQAWKVTAKNLRLPDAIDEDGFFDKSRTPLPDALELLDLHLVPAPAGRYRKNREEQP